MILDATIQQVNRNSLLVREINSGNEYIVNNVPNAIIRFSRGNCVRVNHTGQMTLSIPPQISAISVQRIACDSVRPPHPSWPSTPSRPSEMTGIILQIRNNEILIMDISNNRPMNVRTPHANHFCIGQRVIVTYDSIRMSTPPEVDAIDIIPVC